MRDTTAAEVAEHVYRDLTTDGEPHPDGAAEALHRAVRRQRDAAPSRRVPFIHFGP